MLDVEIKLKTSIQQALKEAGADIELDKIIIERSKDKTHGDYATTVAMQMAKTLHKSPRDIASLIVEKMNCDIVDKIEIAGPGFINFFMKADSLSQIIKVIIDKGDKYGESQTENKDKINVEFVSANPTGDLHLGHARGAAIGDCICRLYEKAGYDVTREYYVNDAGNQINNLAKSLRVRYHEALGDFSLEFPEDGYHSDDLKKLAQIMVDEVGDKYLKDSDESFEYFKRRGTELELNKLIDDLKMFRVHFDVFSSELAIRNAGKVDKVLEDTKKYQYTEDGALFIRTTDFTDDKDRVIIKSDGAYTYLLPDIAYHQDKLQRGFTKLVDVLGADHHGYIERMKSALQMLGYGKDVLDVELIQMVRLLKNGVEYKMSKRTGNAVSMKELCEEVGVDAVRYFFVSRASTSHLDFDLDLASKMESTNPVFYAQYAHARICAVLEKAKDMDFDYEGKALKEEKEIALLKILASFPKEVAQAAEQRAPYKITNYIQKLATAIHEFYSDCRVIDESKKEETASRLALCLASKIVMKNALETIGVSAPEKM
ncbi:MAG: arginine--tRNA ligase [Bacilli bacterium]|nr:arginine--tRNA ligase [Bacillales bacterium]MDY2745787.1 arginine--tRNA ligase [Bacilli bacterium]MDY3890328.1 arginine--tRNA ligase [Bacilli bacterium]